jgi:hypothetical protein
MISAEALSSLLHKLYSAPVSLEVWPEFLLELSSSLKLTGAAILHHDLEKENYNVQYSCGGDTSWTSLYRQYYGSLDVWRPASRIWTGELLRLKRKLVTARRGLTGSSAAYVSRYLDGGPLPHLSRLIRWRRLPAGLNKWRTGYSKRVRAGMTLGPTPDLKLSKGFLGIETRHFTRRSNQSA